jgi:integrase
MKVVPMGIIAAQLGHSSTRITERIYEVTEKTKCF